MRCVWRARRAGLSEGCTFFKNMPETKLHFHGGPLDGLVFRYVTEFDNGALTPFPPLSYQFPFRPKYFLDRKIDGGYVYKTQNAERNLLPATV